MGAQRRRRAYLLPALLVGVGAALLAADQAVGLAWALVIAAAWLAAVSAEAGLSASAGNRRS